MGGDIEVVRGTARDFARQVRDAQGETFGDPNADGASNPSPFLSSDTLSASVWPGGATAAVLSPTPTWVDATTATFSWSLAEADTATLPLGKYAYQAFVTRSGRTGKVDTGTLAVLASAGTDAPPLAFTTLDDLLEYAPWIQDLQADSDMAGFAREQARASNQLISDLVMMWKNGNGLVQAGQPGWNAGTLFGFGSAPPSKWLRDNLTPFAPGASLPSDVAPNRNNTTPNLLRPAVSTALLLYDEVLEICAKRAIALVCKYQIGRDSSKSWWELERMYRLDAANLFKCQKFEVDLSVPQQGWASFTIHGGAASLR